MTDEQFTVEDYMSPMSKFLRKMFGGIVAKTLNEPFQEWKLNPVLQTDLKGAGLTISPADLNSAIVGNVQLSGLRFFDMMGMANPGEQETQLIADVCVCAKGITTIKCDAGNFVLNFEAYLTPQMHPTGRKASFKLNMDETNLARTAPVLE